MTPTQEKSRDQLPSHDHERRRQFLRRLLGGGAAIAAIPTTTIVLAAAGGKGGRRRGGRGGPVADTKELAARLIKEFDKDGDKALNQTELAAAIKASHERGRQGTGEEASSKSGKKGKGGRKKS